jgi:hypothetical protein
MRAPARAERSCVLGLLVVAIGTAGASYAAEWSMESSVALRSEYNDNIELTSAPHPTVWGLLLAPEIKFSGTTETTNVTGGVRFSVNRYSESNLNTVDHSVGLRSSYQAERNRFAFDFDSVRDSTLVSELLETGVVQVRRQRDRLTANPSWRHSLTEATAITVSYGYTDVRYADTHNTSLSDYRDQQLSVGAISNLTERAALTLSAYYDWYETDPRTFEAKTAGIQARYDHAFSETLRGSVAVGARNTRSTQSSQAFVCSGPILFGLCFGDISQVTLTRSDRSTGLTFLGSIDRKFETALLTAQLSREIYPTGIGAIVETDRLGGAWQQQWSPTVTFFVDASVYHTRYVGNFVSGSNTRYWRIEPRVTWKITDNWTLLSGYSHSRVAYENNSASAAANVAYVVLSYTWPKLSVSR